MERTYAEYAAHQAVELLAIDSPTGFTRQAAEWVLNAFRSLGCWRHMPTPWAAWWRRSREMAACG